MMSNFRCCVFLLLMSYFLVTEAVLPAISPIKLPTLDELKERWAQRLQNRSSLSNLRTTTPKSTIDLKQRLAEKFGTNQATTYHKSKLEVPETISDLRQRLADRYEKNLNALKEANIQNLKMEPKTISDFKEEIAERLENRRELLKSAAKLAFERRTKLEDLNNDKESIIPVLESPQYEASRQNYIAHEEDVNHKIANIFTTEAPYQRVLPLQPPIVDPTSPSPFLRNKEKLYIDPPSSTTEIQTRGLNLEQPKIHVPFPSIPAEKYDTGNSDSSFDYGDFKTVTAFLRDVPRGKRVLHLGRQAIRRAMHSFINNDNHNLEAIAPRAHHILNTIGRIILPHPDKLLLTENVPSLIPEHVFQRRLRRKMRLQQAQTLA